MLTRDHSSKTANTFHFKLSKIALACITSSILTPVCADTVSQQITFNSVSQSMWNSGESLAFSNIDDPLFLGTTWDESGKILSLGDPTKGGNGVSVSGSTSGKVGLELGWKVDSGTLHTSLPFNFTLDTPDRSQLFEGNTFQFGVTNATLDSDAFMRSVSPAVQMYADLIFKAKASVSAKGCYNVLFDSGCSSTKTAELFDIDNSGSSLGRELLSVNIAAEDRSAAIQDGEIRVLGGFSPLIAAGSGTAKLLEGSISQEEERKKKEGLNDSGLPDDSAPPQKKSKISVTPKPKVSVGLSDLAEVDVKLPEIDALGRSGSNINITGIQQSNLIATSASDEFLSVAFDVDTAGALLGIVPPLGAEASVDFGIGSVGASVDLIDLTLTPSLSLTQDLSLAINDVSVAYEFGSGQRIETNNLTDKIDVFWSSDNTKLDITPYYSIAASVTNQTGLAVDFNFTVDLLKGSIGAEILGIDIGNAAFGPLASLPVDLGGFAIPSIFDSTFGLGGFSEMRGQTINIGVSQAQFKAGLGDWDASSSWTGINSTPSSTTDVQLGRTGQGAYTSHAEIDDIGNQSESVGNLTIKSGSRLDIGGRNIDNVNENSISNSLTITGNKISIDGSVGVYTNDTLFIQSSTTTTLTGTGYISLNNGGTLTSATNSNATINMSGHDFRFSTASETSKINEINRINLNLDSGGQMIVNNIDRLSLTNTTVNNRGTTYSIDGNVWLNDSTLVNIDNAQNLTVNNSTTVNNYSAWAAGQDGLLLNNGNVTIQTTKSGLAELELRSGKVFVGIGNTLDLTNNGTIRVTSGGGGLAQIEAKPNVVNLLGDGRIQLSQGLIVADNNINKLVNSSEHTIAGRGSIEGFKNSSGGLVNDGVIIAQGFLDLTDNRLLNNGLLKADFNSRLHVDATNMVNVSVTTGGSFFNPNNVIDLGAGGEYFAEQGGIINFATGDDKMNKFVNRASLVLNGPNAQITVSDTASIFGGTNFQEIDELSTFENRGTLKLVNHIFAEDDFINFFDSNEFVNFGTVLISGNSRLKGVSNRQSGLIEGHGTIEGGGDLINGKLINRGTIRATGEGRTLRVELPDSISTTWQNTGRVEVMNGANLVFVDKGIESFFSNGDTFSGGGVWAAYADDLATRIQFDAGSAFGGGVKILDNVELILSGNNAQFFTLSSNGATALRSSLQTINNDAILSLKNGKVFNATQQVTNQGTINLENGFLIGNTVVNNGLITGSGALASGGTIDNNNIIRAANGFLDIRRNIDNQGGRIEAGSGASTSQGELGDILRLNNRTITQGEVLVKENALFQGVGSLNNVKLTNRGRTITSANFNTLSVNLANGSVNTGLLGSDNGGTLNLSGFNLNNAFGVLSTENASIVLNDVSVTNGAVEIKGDNATLRGHGVLQDVALKIVEGALIADVNGKRLSIDPSEASLLISANLSARNGGTLALKNGLFFGSGGTKIEALNGSTVELENTNVSNTEFSTSGSGSIITIASNSITNSSLTGNVQVTGSGDINFNGINRLSGSLTSNAGAVINLYDASLIGQNLVSSMVDGETVFTPTIEPGDLILQSSSRLQGSGSIVDINIIQNGLILANQSNALMIDDASDLFTNNGELIVSGTGGLILNDSLVVNNNRVSIAENSQLTFSNTYQQNSGETEVIGQVSGGSIILAGGLFYGKGSVFADMEVQESSIVSGLNGVGGLNFSEDLTLDGTLNVDLVSSSVFDVFNVDNILNISSSTTFVFNFADTFDFFDGLEIEFLNTGSIIDLSLFDYSNLIFEGLETTLERSFGLSQDRLSLIVSFKVSEPSSYILMLLGFASILGARKKVH